MGGGGALRGIPALPGPPGRFLGTHPASPFLYEKGRAASLFPTKTGILSVASILVSNLPLSDVHLGIQRAEKGLFSPAFLLPHLSPLSSQDSRLTQPGTSADCERGAFQKFAALGMTHNLRAANVLEIISPKRVMVVVTWKPKAGLSGRSGYC